MQACILQYKRNGNPCFVGTKVKTFFFLLAENMYWYMHAEVQPENHPEGGESGDNKPGPP